LFLSYYMSFIWFNSPFTWVWSGKVCISLPYSAEFSKKDLYFLHYKSVWRYLKLYNVFILDLSAHLNLINILRPMPSGWSWLFMALKDHCYHGYRRGKLTSMVDLQLLKYFMKVKVWWKKYILTLKNTNICFVKVWHWTIFILR